MPNFPLEVVVGADVLAPHFCSLLYLMTNRKRLQFGIQVCPRCAQYRGEPDVGSQKQLRFVDCSLKRKRNRTRVGYNYLATLPEAVCDDSDCKKAEKLDETPSPLDEPDGSQLHQLIDPGHTLSTSPASSKSPASATSTKINSSATSNKANQSGRL